jgi:hypothetical protein
MAINVTSEWTEVKRWSDAAATYQNAEWRLLVRSVETAASNVSTVYFKIQKSQSNAGGYVRNEFDKSMRIDGYGANGDGHSAYMTWQYGYNDSTSWSDVDGDASDMWWGNVQHKNDGSLTVSAHIYGDRVFSTESLSTYVDLTFPTIARTPSAPTSCTASAGNGDMAAVGETVTVSWSGASGTITGYESQWRYDNGEWSNSTDRTGTGFTDTWNDGTKWMAGKTIQYRVRAKNGSLASAWKESNTLTVSGAMRVKASNAWKTGSTWVKINNTWKRAKRVYVKVNGVWKQSK